MSKRDEALQVLVIAAIVAVIFGAIYFIFKPRPRVVTGSGARLVETVDPGAGDSGRRSLIHVVNQVSFDLDKFEPRDPAEQMLLGAARFARHSQAVAEAYEASVDDYQADLKRHFPVWSKAAFYESKGEYNKALKLLADLSKQQFRSPRFKQQVFFRMAAIFEVAGDRKQSLRAMLRAVETLEQAGASDPAALKAERVRIMKELNALGG